MVKYSDNSFLFLNLKISYTKDGGFFLNFEIEQMYLFCFSSNMYMNTVKQEINLQK